MAESTPIKDANNAVVPVATDIATIGGEQVTVQRVKCGYGQDGQFSDMGEKPAADATLLDLFATIQVLNQTLAALASMMPQPDALRRLRVYLDAGNNAAVNVGQWGGQTAAVGAGAAGNGAPRVTPSNDTVAGSPQMFALYQSMLAPGMTAFYDRATY